MMPPRLSGLVTSSSKSVVGMSPVEWATMGMPALSMTTAMRQGLAPIDETISPMLTGLERPIGTSSPSWERSTMTSTSLAM